MKPECNNCRWKSKRYLGVYPCCDCIGLHKLASYNFFCFPDQLNMFGVAELCHCRSCGVCIWNLAVVAISIFAANVEIPCRQK